MSSWYHSIKNATYLFFSFAGAAIPVKRKWSIICRSTINLYHELSSLSSCFLSIIPLCTFLDLQYFPSSFPTPSSATPYLPRPRKLTIFFFFTGLHPCPSALRFRLFPPHSHPMSFIISYMAFHILVIADASNRHTKLRFKYFGRFQAFIATNTSFSSHNLMTDLFFL